VHERAGHADRQPARLLHEAVEVDAVDVFHREEVRRADRAGVVGVDDVRVGELADRLDLLVELPDRFRFREELFPDDSEGDGAVHQAVARLEDLAEHVVAEPFEDDVGRQDELIAGTLEEHVDLVGGEPLAFEQRAGEGAGIAASRQELLGNVVLLRRRQELAQAERVDQIGCRIDRHGERIYHKD
jgi:hypothetical protein